MRGALAAQAGSPARSRLLTLAKRPAYRALADRASAGAADGNAPSTAAVALRIAVLEAQGRRDDLERFLLTLLDRTPSLELMTDLGAQAERLGFESVRTRSLARQIEVMRDPIDKLQLRYALVRLYESRGELDLARKTLDAVYAENPRILGIVRQTADYYWRHNQGREAIAVLTRAASQSYPALKKQLTYEAALKSTQIADYVQARELLKPLLADDPFNADYLAAVADSYALARDDRSLRDFYKSTIDAMRTAPLDVARGGPISVDERTRRIAGLRRGLIPSLARLNDHAGAIDQYIEIINRYPDDDQLLQEAGRYARQHARTDQLLAYYTKTAADSPRDYRWPMLLAKLETQFEDFPAAIAAYATASAIRPDRADFQTARGSLEERLMRFDDAVVSYGKTYELTYHDPQWMEKIAELRARQGRVDEAAKALRTALVDGRPERAEIFFAVARRLEQWRMPEAARSFVDQGARLAGPAGLLENGGTYVSVYTGLRQSTAAFDRLFTAWPEAVATLGPNGNGASLVNALNARLGEMADVIARTYSPEEKTAFVAFLEQKRVALPRGNFEMFLVPFAERAGLLELAVRWRTELMQATRQNRVQPASPAARGCADQPVAFRGPGERARAVRGFRRACGVRRPRQRGGGVPKGWRSGGRAAGVGEDSGDQPFRCAAHALFRAAARTRSAAPHRHRRHPRCAHRGRRRELRRRSWDLRSGDGGRARARAGAAARLDHRVYGARRPALRAIRRLRRPMRSRPRSAQARWASG